jgi:acyl-CoA synthetase (AMP-forming)/AMP-acid ligase II
MQGTVSSAPNFGFALAARKTEAEEVKQLNLQHVRILMDAAEPVREANVRAFLSRFQPAGITPSVYTPGYGLAEHGAWAGQG